MPEPPLQDPPDVLETKTRQMRARCRAIATADTFTAAQRDQAIKDLARMVAKLLPPLIDETREND
jgi:hypothetical protein